MEVGLPSFTECFLKLEPGLFWEVQSMKKGLEEREWLVGLVSLRGWRRNGVETRDGKSVAVMALGKQSGPS